jgi:hypothetical protein
VRPSPEQVAAVEAWLREMFPGADVATGDDFKADYQWFRLRKPGAKDDPPVFVVTFEAFEDNTAEAIIAALRRRRVAEHLRATPAQPLMLDRFLRLRPAP